MEQEAQVQTAEATNEQVVVSQPPVTSLETALQEIARLKFVNEDVIKSRDSTKRKLKEFETNYNTEKEVRVGLESKFRDMTVNGALKQALTDAGTLSLDTAFKLVDKSSIKLLDNGELDVESLKATVEAIKAEHAILFKQAEAQDEATEEATIEIVKLPRPAVARAAEATSTQTAYELALSKAKSPAEIHKIIKQFNAA